MEVTRAITASWSDLTLSLHQLELQVNSACQCRGGFRGGSTRVVRAPFLLACSTTISFKSWLVLISLTDTYLQCTDYTGIFILALSALLSILFSKLLALQQNHPPPRAINTSDRTTLYQMIKEVVLQIEKLEARWI